MRPAARRRSVFSMPAALCFDRDAGEREFLPTRNDEVLTAVALLQSNLEQGSNPYDWRS